MRPLNMYSIEQAMKNRLGRGLLPRSVELHTQVSRLAEDSFYRRANRPRQFPAHFDSFPSGWFAVCKAGEVPDGRTISRVVCGSTLCLAKPAPGLLVGFEGTCARCEHPRPASQIIECGHLSCIACGEKEPVPQSTSRSVRSGMSTVLDTRVIDGIAYVYITKTDDPPAFEIASDEGSEYGPSVYQYFARTVCASVVENAENHVDLGHYGHVHGFRNADPNPVISTSGSTWICQTQLSRLGGELAHFAFGELELQFVCTGLGHLEVQIEAFGVIARLRVLMTPLARPDELQVLYGVACHAATGREGSLPVALRLLPPAVFESLVPWLYLRATEKDLAQDFEYWETRRVVGAYRNAPTKLVGEIRMWANQFYAHVPEHPTGS